MKRTTVVIAALAVSNIATGAYVLYLARPKAPVEHIGRVHLDIDGGRVFRVTLERRDRSTSELILTPRATVELQDKLGRMTRAIERAAKQARDSAI